MHSDLTCLSPSKRQQGIPVHENGGINICPHPSSINPLSPPPASTELIASFEFVNRQPLQNQLGAYTPPRRFDQYVTLSAGPLFPLRLTLYQLQPQLDSSLLTNSSTVNLLNINWGPTPPRRFDQYVTLSAGPLFLLRLTLYQLQLQLDSSPLTNSSTVNLLNISWGPTPPRRFDQYVTLTAGPLFPLRLTLYQLQPQPDSSPLTNSSTVNLLNITWGPTPPRRFDQYVTLSAGPLFPLRLTLYQLQPQPDSSPLTNSSTVNLLNITWGPTPPPTVRPVCDAHSGTSLTASSNPLPASASIGLIVSCEFVNRHPLKYHLGTYAPPTVRFVCGVHSGTSLPSSSPPQPTSVSTGLITLYLVVNRHFLLNQLGTSAPPPTVRIVSVWH